LMAAAQRNRILVSHNWKDFRLLHLTWQHWASEWHVAQQHAGILIVPQSLWTPDQMAQELVAFVSSPQPLMNTLHRWRQGLGWVSFP
jgi:hypothetical protein